MKARVQYVLALALLRTSVCGDVASCQAWCDNPCATLNGDIQGECGGCTAQEAACRPGAPGYPAKDEAVAMKAMEAAPPPTEKVPLSRQADGAAIESDGAPLAGESLCARLVAKGYCESYPRHMHENCAGSCSACHEPPTPRVAAECSTSGSGTDDNDDDCEGMSAAVGRSTTGDRQPMSVPQLPASLSRGQDSWCGVLEDESRVIDRGYYVARAVVPPEELARMHQSVLDLGVPTRYLCAASNVQPAACRSTFEDLAAAYPETGLFVRLLHRVGCARACTYAGVHAWKHTYARTRTRAHAHAHAHSHVQVRRLLRRWTDSGFATAAGLGIPLEPVRLVSRPGRSNFPTLETTPALVPCSNPTLLPPTMIPELGVYFRASTFAIVPGMAWHASHAGGLRISLDQPLDAAPLFGLCDRRSLRCRSSV